MDASVPIEDAEDAWGKEEALVVWMRRDDEQVFGGLQLLGQQPHIAANEVGKGPLQQWWEQQRQQGNLDEAAQSEAR